MARRKPPKVDGSRLPKRPEDELGVFLERLRHRIKNNISSMNRGDINAAYVAFEALGPLMPLLCSGEFSHEEIKGAYPVDSWRKQTVEIPAELFEIIVKPWNDYASQTSGKTLDACYGFERTSGQGRRPMRQKQAHNDASRKISNSVVIAYVDLGDDRTTTLEEAISEAADTHGVSFETAKRAYERFGRDTIAELQKLTVGDGPEE